MMLQRTLKSRMRLPTMAWLDIVERSDWKTPTWWGGEVIEGSDGIRRTARPAKVFEDE